MKPGLYHSRVLQYLELVLGLEVIIPVAVTIVLATIAGGHTLWKNAKAEATDASDKLDLRIKELENKQKEYLDKETLKQILDRLDKMEVARGQYITREEFTTNQRRLEDAFERFSATLTQTTTAMTSRMDSVLFEIASQRNNKSHV